jgi:hypothetical protein
MKPIKAIVLTYDKYHRFTEHMIFCYERLWPDHPFIFQIPYQKIQPSIQTKRAQYHRCPSDIKGTVLTLLESLDDEEMIYWCIDDKYPIWLDLGRIRKIHQWVTENDQEDVAGILFCRCRGMRSVKNLTGKELLDRYGNIYLERKNYKQIWIHQYLKVNVIQHLFESFPDHIPNPKMMDYLKNEMEKPNSHRIYTTENNLAIFGESTSQGLITKNCFNSMNANEIPIPSWVSETTSHEIIMGKRLQRKLRWHKKLAKCFIRRIRKIRF